MTGRPGLPWPVGAATGVGSLPGTDIAEAQRVVLGELPDLPHLPELPARGPGADMIGRGAALLAELPVELYAARWRIASRPGHDLRVARDYLQRDLDTLSEQASEYTGSFKIQATGPWTLAASLDLPVGGLVLRDAGATRDLASSLAEGLRAHVAEVRARLPRATTLLQLDEPALPAVLAGRVPTESGFGTLRPVEPSVARSALREMIESVGPSEERAGEPRSPDSTAIGVPVIVHCCAADVPFGLLREAGVTAVGVDLSLVGDLDALGELIDEGVGLLAGVTGPSSSALADAVRDVWRKLGFPAAAAAARVVVTPRCGLAHRPAAQVRPLLAACRDAGRRLADDAG